MAKQSNTPRVSVTARKAAYKALIEGVKLDVDAFIASANSASAALMDTVSRLAANEALQGLTFEQYKTQLAPALDAQIDRLPVGGKPQYKINVRTAVLAAAHGLAFGSLSEAPKVLAKLKAIKVVPTSNRGRKASPTETPAETAKADEAPASNPAGAPVRRKVEPGSIVTRDDLLSAAFLNMAVFEPLKATEAQVKRANKFVDLMATSDGRTVFSKWIDAL